MKKIFQSDSFWLTLILVLAIFLYFWKIGQWQYLSYDEARDYIIIKRILVDKKFTLIGPSLGVLDGGYLPPFYYYWLVPSLLLSKFHIWGPDVFSATLAISAVIAFYMVAKNFFGKFPALIGGLFFVFNPYLIQAARHTRDPHMLPLFLLIFIFSFKKFLIDKKSWFLLTAAISLGIAVSLHLTVAVFLPLLVFLFFQEFKKRGFSKVLSLSFLGLIIFFLPLVFFDLRHDFSLSRAVLSFLAGKGGLAFERILWLKTERLVVFLIKLPLIFFSGTFQKALLSLRAMPFSSIERINIFSVSNRIEQIKLILSVILWITTIVVTLPRATERKLKIVFIFVFFGFLISFMCPQKACFLYYFYSLFPFFFLLLSGAIFFLWEKSSQRKRIALTILLVAMAIMPFFPDGLKTEIRPEKYFLPVCQIIANDFPQGKKVAIVSNVGDFLRWEHNALEYRYFLEAIYKQPLGGWGVDDYKTADILYFIDEGEFKDPLNFNGMEMEMFAPKKISEIWKANSGQKIYKMEK